MTPATAEVPATSGGDLGMATSQSTSATAAEPWMLTAEKFEAENFRTQK